MAAAEKRDTATSSAFKTTLLGSLCGLCWIGWKTWQKKPKKHLIIHMDVNKTMIMIDPVQKKNIDCILNDILASVSWGYVAKSNEKTDSFSINGQKWVLDKAMPISGIKPNYCHSSDNNNNNKDANEEYMTYMDWIHKCFPYSGQVNREMQHSRRVLSTSFTNKGHPGHCIYESHYQTLYNMLHKDSENTQPYFILPTFWNMLDKLVNDKNDTSFSIIFRTFGTDSSDVIKEFNQYIENKECGYENLSLKRENMGVIVRDKNGTHLIMGIDHKNPNDYFRVCDGLTLEKLLKEDRMKYYYDYAKTHKNIKFIRNEKNIYQYIYYKSYILKETLAIIDDYIYWAMNNEQSHSGKIMVIDTNTHDNAKYGNIHQIFFDDCIATDQACIVDVRDLANVKKTNENDENGKSMIKHECECISESKFNTMLKEIHLLRVEPFEIISNHDYFLQRIKQAQDNLSNLNE